MDKVKKEEIDDLIEYINSFISIVNENKYNVVLENTHSFSTNYFLNSFNYNINIWESISIILPSTLNKNMNYPLGILSRSVLTDVITLNFLLHKLKKSEKLFNDEIENLSYEFNKSFDDYYKGVYEKNIEKYNSIMKKQHEHNLLDGFDFFSFKDGNCKIKSHKTTSIKDMYSYDTDTDDKLKIKFHFSFIYKFYSQYEHKSIDTIEMTKLNRYNFKQLILTFRATFYIMHEILIQINLLDKDNFIFDDLEVKTKELLDKFS